MSLTPAFVHAVPFMSVSSSSSSSSDRAARSSATSPAMRALVAAWLADVSETSCASPRIKLDEDLERKSRNFLTRLANALHITSDSQPHVKGAHSSITKRSRHVGSTEKAHTSNAGTGRLDMSLSKSKIDGGMESLSLSSQIDESSLPTPQCVSALCSSLYSTLTSKQGNETLKSLPFLFADTSAEARSLLEAMRKARAKAIEAARREHSQSTALGKILSAIGAVLLSVANPFK